MIRSDCHAHSSFSSDSEESMENMINAALEKGLSDICFTEHNEQDSPDGDFRLDTAAYKAELLRRRAEFAGKINVLFGVELGIYENIAEKHKEYIDEWGFDFVIASSHYVDGIDPYYPEYFEKNGEKNGMLRYFESILKSVEAFSDFDVFGHLDYAARYTKSGGYEPLDFREIIDEILKKLVASGKGTEINTAGLKNLAYPNPHEFILRRFKELGGEIITVGADAHDASRVAADFDKAEAALLKAGFKYYAVFKNRTAELFKITD